MKIWKKIIIPAWLEFWEKGLTPEEVINKIQLTENNLGQK